MAKPYSYDLRQKVIQPIELDGWKKSKAAKIFQISRNTIDLWLKKREKTGDYRPLSNRRGHSQTKIKDWKQFKKFAHQYGNKTQGEMALLWHEEISPRTISRGLKKIGFTRKKRTTAIKKEMNVSVVNSSEN